jgi:hypothetical protein
VSESSAFAWLCSQVEEATGFSRIEARGTVRLALKELGLLAADLTPNQASSVAAHALPRELGARGVGDAEALCCRLADEAKTLPDERSGAAPDEIFGELSKA